jgi:adenylate cyclase
MTTEIQQVEAPAPRRRPLALVFCDIAGTTQLFAEEGDLAASAVIQGFIEHAGRLAKEYEAYWIKFIGDGFFAVFENISNVIPLVIRVHRLLSEDPMFSGRKLSFKFSLHYGDVLYIETSYGNEVLGQDVNIVAHLNDLAQSHEIVISETALKRLPSDYRVRAGVAESRHFRQGGDVEFRRINLLGL